MMKTTRSILILSTLILGACGGGSSSSDNSAEAAEGCISGEGNSSSGTLSNSCNIDINVKLFDSLFDSEDKANNRSATLVPANQTVSVAGISAFSTSIAACAAPREPRFKRQDFGVKFVACE